MEGSYDRPFGQSASYMEKRLTLGNLGPHRVKTDTSLQNLSEDVTKTAEIIDESAISTAKDIVQIAPGLKFKQSAPETIFEGAKESDSEEDVTTSRVLQPKEQFTVNTTDIIPRKSCESKKKRKHKRKKNRGQENNTAQITVDLTPEGPENLSHHVIQAANHKNGHTVLTKSNAKVYETDFLNRSFNNKENQPANFGNAMTTEDQREQTKSKSNKRNQTFAVKRFY